MFWSDDLLTAKKGSFGIVWLAATLGPRNKRITRKQLTTVDLTKTCELLQDPPEPMALRLSGCLLVGVARVYNQNYELFYADVNSFHQSLRIATDFSTAAEVSVAGKEGLDLSGGGKSKLDQITFAGVDVGWQSTLTLQFANIDWTNPFGKRRQRRGTSKLESLQSQKTQTQIPDSDEGSSDESEDVDDENQLDSPETRRKRKKADSSLNLATTIKMPSRLSSHPRSDHHDQESMLVPIDLGLDLDLPLAEAGNDSFSAPSRGAIDLPSDHNTQNDEFFIARPSELVGEQTPNERAEPPGAVSPHRKRKGPADSDEDSLQDVDESLRPTRKVKKGKQVTVDDDLEISETLLSDARYEALMIREHQAARVRDDEKHISGRVSAMVDGGGNWIEFFDPDMQDLFATLTKPPQFLWEREVQAAKRGEKWALEGAAEWNHGQTGMDNVFTTNMLNEVEDIYPTQQLPEDQQTVAQTAGYQDDVEGARKMSSQAGLRESQIPWNDVSFDTPGGGFNSDYTPLLHRLSTITPQEARIRLNSYRRSGSQVRGGRYRSRSSSLVDQGNEALMLAPGNDNEDVLPVDDIAQSQTSEYERRRGNLPEAFHPAYLATLENQCRSFMTFVETKMLGEGKDEIRFGDLVSGGSRKVYAALAFHNCLTLATKNILRIHQAQPWEDFSVQFTVALRV